MVMAMNGKQSNRGDNNQAAEKGACRARMFCSATNLVECLVTVDSCQWHLPFGTGMFCKHPLKRKIAEGELLSGWSAGASEAP